MDGVGEVFFVSRGADAAVHRKFCEKVIKCL